MICVAVFNSCFIVILKYYFPLVMLIYESIIMNDDDEHSILL